MHWRHVTTLAEAEAYVALLNAESDYVVLDLETTGLDAFSDSILAFVLADSRGEGAAYLEPVCLPALQKLSTTKTLVLHNFRFDFHFLERAGIQLGYRDVVYDTMLAHHLLDENASHALDNIIQAEWADDYKQQFWAKHASFQEAPLQDRVAYACKDAIYTGRLYQLLRSRLAAGGIPDSLVTHVHKLAYEFYEAEHNGLKVDLPYLTEVGTRLQTRIRELKLEMRAVAPAQCEAVEYTSWLKEIEKFKTTGRRAQVPKPEISFDSPAQLNELLYNRLQLPVQLNKKTKRPSVDDDALATLAGRHPVVDLLREYRGHAKVYGTYIEGTLERMLNGRIYAEFHVNGTVTGRASSSNPNLHQLPKDGGVRGIYVPDDEHYLLSCDYSQLEVVIAAHYSQDPNLLKIIHEGASKHDITAEGVGLPRQTAKTLNFAMQYLCGPRKVAEIVGCSQKEGEYVWNKYWQTYAGEKKVVDECKAKVDRGEPIVNPFGRRRRFPTKFSAHWEKERAYRQAYSSLIQGTGADVTHLAYYSTANLYRARGLGRALFEIHDEILTMPKKGTWQEAQEVLKSQMILAGVTTQLTVPLTVNCSDALTRWEK